MTPKNDGNGDYKIVSIVSGRLHTIGNGYFNGFIIYVK